MLLHSTRQVPWNVGKEKEDTIPAFDTRLAAFDP